MMESTEPVDKTTELITHNDDKQDNSNEEPVNETEQDCEAAEPPLSAPVASEGGNEDSEDAKPTLRRRLIDFYWQNEFLILVVIVILLAKAYPPLGAQYLAQEITAGWIAVMIIFLLAGLGMDTKEFSQALTHMRFNVAVQGYNFGVDSAITFGVSRALLAMGALPQALADGLVICSCLPLSISMVAVLAKCAGGDEASAVFHAAFGNFLGVFLSPPLVLGYLGVAGSVDMVDVLYKLIIRVIVPVLVGQVLQKFCPPVVRFATTYKSSFNAIKQYALVYIIYTIFCLTFADDSRDTHLGDIFILIATILVLLIFLMALAWGTFHVFFHDEPKLRITALFAATHKTISIGVPLITTMYDGDPNVGLYTVPLIIWYTMQLVLGTALCPKLKTWAHSEQKRLGLPDDEASDDESSPSSSSDDLQDADVEAVPDKK